MREFCRPIGKRARMIGAGYTPKMCYKDMRRIDLLDDRLGYPDEHVPAGSGIASSPTRQFLLELMYENVRKNPQLQAEEFIERSRHQQWRIEKGIPYGRDGVLGEAFKKFVKRLTVAKVALWSLIFYLRLILIWLCIFLMRMAERDGIVTTIRSDRKKFVRALLLWPEGMFTYPYNVVKEIRVEAEIRRDEGKLLLQLTAQEKTKIREVAAAPDFDYQLQTLVPRPVHGLALALMVTVFLNLFGCFIWTARANAETNKKHEPVTMSVRAGPQLVRFQCDGPGLGCNALAAVMPKMEYVVWPPETWERISEVGENRPTMRRLAVDHVPWLMATRLTTVCE